ncbi:N-acetylmuramoyl-L-alanine amidase [Dolichospermum circinale CS-534/05]|uniref:hormogonium tapered terminus morphoprotein TftA n=1 Tax=Dolichospermum circinale TaxID=109265 RepID=UPI00232DE899|nr:N-acetylmuramoyl-L-alanine amidase [Dolichospermum circinale]MDB9456483.1 N-acetylmuramoyl-L-alanine amidase [Dolichospermum circinale CS-541/06]MDB9464310.1 N-acetylmuramoyl-L-alanine amidase [Dolichospermum circinale CS-541/04]MDB9491586.1 N-acetylmuramoyl-L-alanine amidase [Dolichospermum circinale CS-534/05]MDB9547650.1 N-acetylmuramoyl-L-alanine amidase [Dolichospermum circinale CS-1031]
MGRIFISAGHFTGESGAISVLGTKEADEMIQTRDALIQELESRGLKKDQDFFSVPDTINLKRTIAWINDRSRSGDIAVELHGNSANAPAARGAESYYTNGNNQRKADAEKLLNALLAAVPGLINRGAKPDNASQHSRLAFCRDVDIPSVLIELCFLSSRDDMNLLTNQRDKFAKGLADGLLEWSGTTVVIPPSTSFPAIDIEINGQRYEEQGIIVNDNSFIPVDLAARLGIDLAQLNNIRRVSQNGIVFIKAVELQPFNISVKWDTATRTIILGTATFPKPIVSEQIMGIGSATENQLKSLLQANNPNALNQFPDLPRLYIEESTREGVNHDIAFSQMCLETGYLDFGGDVEPSQNNFCGLGTTGGGVKGASFPDARTGVKAHIQHLKAYASKDPVVPPIVDPRFDLVARGIASLVSDLSGLWATDPNYGNKILAVQRRLLDIV